MKSNLHLKTQLMDENTGEIICGCGCGTVLDDKISNRSYSERQKDASPIMAKRTGQQATLALHDQGLSTVMGNAKTDFNGDKLKLENLELFFRLNRINNNLIQSHNKQSRKLIKPLQEIQKIGEKMSLPPGTIKQAQYILHKCNSKKITNHHLATSVAAVCLFLACRINGAPRKMQEFVQICGHKWAFYRLIQSILESIDFKTQINDPVKLIPGICRQIHTDKHVEEFAIRILQEAIGKAWGGGKSPNGVAAATDLTQPSISNTIKELENVLN